jgi:hypothetical protein
VSHGRCDQVMEICGSCLFSDLRGARHGTGWRRSYPVEVVSVNVSGRSRDQQVLGLREAHSDAGRMTAHHDSPQCSWPLQWRLRC